MAQGFFRWVSTSLSRSFEVSEGVEKCHFDAEYQSDSASRSLPSGTLESPFANSLKRLAYNFTLCTKTFLNDSVWLIEGS